MLEHYSHIRIDAKRHALEALDAARRGTDNGGSETDDGDGGTTSDAPTPAKNAQEIPLVVALAEGFTSQSGHSLALAGSPPSAKLLIPLARRDVRVVEGARLESHCGEQPQASPRHFIAQSLNDLAAKADHSVCVDKPRYGLRF
jgi:hypothetical protein